MNKILYGGNMNLYKNISYCGSSLLAEEHVLDATYLGLRINFARLTETEMKQLQKQLLEDLFFAFTKDFYVEILHESLEGRDRKLSVKKLSSKRVPMEGILTMEGDYKDRRFGFCRTYRSLEKYRDRRMEDTFDDEEDEWESLSSDLEERLNQNTVSTDTYLEPELSSSISIQEENRTWKGVAEFGISGYVLNYNYEAMIEYLISVFDKISEISKSIVGSIYTYPGELGEISYIEHIRDGLEINYGDWMYEQLLLYGIEWGSYIPDIYLEKIDPKVFTLEEYKTIKMKNGAMLCMNKPIEKVSSQDMRKLRTYLNNILAKGFEECPWDSFLINNEKTPISMDEIQIIRNKWGEKTVIFCSDGDFERYRKYFDR